MILNQQLIYSNFDEISRSNEWNTFVTTIKPVTLDIIYKNVIFDLKKKIAKQKDENDKITKNFKSIDYAQKQHTLSMVPYGSKTLQQKTQFKKNCDHKHADFSVYIVLSIFSVLALFSVGRKIYFDL